METKKAPSSESSDQHAIITRSSNRASGLPLLYSLVNQPYIPFYTSSYACRTPRLGFPRSKAHSHSILTPFPHVKNKLNSNMNLTGEASAAVGMTAQVACTEVFSASSRQPVDYTCLLLACQHRALLPDDFRTNTTDSQSMKMVLGAHPQTFPLEAPPDAGRVRTPPDLFVNAAHRSAIPSAQRSPAS